MKNGLRIYCSDAKYDYTNEFMVRSSAKSIVKSSQSDIVTSRPLLGSLPQAMCHQTAMDAPELA
jgi:hypothetical protein